MKIYIYFFLIVIITSVLFLLIFFLSYSFEGGSGNSAPFECGFHNFTGFSYSFSMPFFVISLMFLLFDVEILLVCFYPLLNFFSYYMSYYTWLVIFLIFSATLYEWFGGILSWL